MIFPIHQMIFYFFSMVLVAASVLVITARNPVKAILFLVLAFFASAVLWMLLQAEFLSLVLLFVYVGAVMTLFLFVVMMIPIDRALVSTRFVRYAPMGFIVFAILVGIAFHVFRVEHWALANSLPTFHNEQYNNITVIGDLLFTRYLLPFELSAVILLVGMVAAITLAFHGKKEQTKSQTIRTQLDATKENRLQVVDLREKKS